MADPATSFFHLIDVKYRCSLCGLPWIDRSPKVCTTQSCKSIVCGPCYEYEWHVGHPFCRDKNHLLEVEAQFVDRNNIKKSAARATLQAMSTVALQIITREQLIQEHRALAAEAAVYLERLNR